MLIYEVPLNASYKGQLDMLGNKSTRDISIPFIGKIVFVTSRGYKLDIFRSWALFSSLLLVLFAGDHVSLGHVERRRVAVGVGRVLEQNRVVILRLRTHKHQPSDTRSLDESGRWAGGGLTRCGGAWIRAR